MFNFSQKPALGLDLSDLSFKIVQLKKGKEGLSLAGFTQKTIPDGLIQKGEIIKQGELAAILRQVLQEGRKNGLEAKQVVCNLPEEKIFIRIVQLPKMREEEISQAIKWEAEANIPLSVDEAYLDWQVIDPIKNHLDHFDVLIAATPKKLVDGYVSVLKKSGLEPLALEPESMAVVRSLIKEDEAVKPLMIVDLGKTGTNFVIFSASSIRFTSKIPISGQDFTRAIMEKLGTDKGKAEELKIKKGLVKSVKIKVGSGKGAEEDKRVYQALEPLINDLAKQIQDYINFYHERTAHVHGPNGGIAQVLLCGGDSLLIDLPSFLSEKLNLPVKLGNPWINIYSTLPKNISGLSLKKSIAYTTALGLALYPHGL